MKAASSHALHMLVVSTLMTTIVCFAQPVRGRVLASDAYQDAQVIGKVVEIQKRSIVISKTSQANFEKGARFEVFATTSDGSQAVVATGTIASAIGDLLIGQLETKTGSVAKDQSVRAVSEPTEEGTAPVSTKADGVVLSVTGKSVVITTGAGATAKVGDEFEIFVPLADDDGVAVIGSGRVTSVTDDLLVGKVEVQNRIGRVARNMKIRFPPKSSVASATATAVQSPAPNTQASSKPIGSFRDVVRRYQRAVCIVKDAKSTAHGTGFVLSKQHRLVATNAHVADVAANVVLNESRTVYKVVRRWFHPDTIRRMRYDNHTVIRSTDARYGGVDPRGTDLAILELEKIGPDLDAEVELARPDEVRDIVGSDIGMLGYPAYDTQASQDQFAQATFVEGSVSRIEGLLGFGKEQLPEHRRRVSFTAPNYSGFSGSPVFLRDGKVILVCNSVRIVSNLDKIAHGIRVDALWDLISLAKMQDKVPGAPELLPDPVLIQRQNPLAQKLLQAVKHVRQARDERKRNEFTAAAGNLSKAEALASHYWWIYVERGRLVDAMIDVGNRSIKDRAVMYEASRANFEKAFNQFHKSFGIYSVEIALDVARQSINVGRFGRNKDRMASAIKLLTIDGLVKAALEGENAAYFLALRATLNKEYGYHQPALADINAAIARESNNASYFSERASIYRALGNSGAAERDESRAAGLKR